MLHNDNKKLEQLFELYSDLMLQHAYYILKDIPTSQDAVSEAFLRVIKIIEKINELDCPKTRKLMVIIVENISKNIYNRRKREALVDFTEIDFENESSLDDFYDIEVKQDMDNILKRLPIDYANILVLTSDGYSTKEIAEILDVNYENARKRLSRAKKSLKKLIEQYESRGRHDEV
ncbi:RNA polymerase sigma factor [Johnsonella ignava]|uniref:RNA polymerase sigma factor n=1 Tax=Johnsonella ignava TaxID=43995 RepID=UPI0023EF56A2|nr:sigma-70 family RNA polymerase sigma factor [Johnsonella ignava]